MYRPLFSFFLLYIYLTVYLFIYFSLLFYFLEGGGWRMTDGEEYKIKNIIKLNGFAFDFI